MSVLQYKHYPGEKVLEVHPEGTVSLDDILGYADEVLDRELISPGTIEIYDLSDMENLQVDYSTTSRLRPTLRRWIDLGWQGSVFYAPDDYRFGMIRMIGGVVEAITDEAPVAFLPRRTPVSRSEARQLIEAERRRSPHRLRTGQQHDPTTPPTTG